MLDKVCIVTGATSGIGRVTALELARMGATVVLMARRPERGEEARAAIVAETGNDRVELILADFASLAEVRRAAEIFLARHDRLHVLVNNAGLYADKRRLSADGYELTFAVNHLAPFLLTNLLLDTLKASAPARVVTVASGAHVGAEINFDDLQGAKRYSGFAAYGASKLANILFTYELARRLEGSGVTANCLHPGFVGTNFGQSDGGPVAIFFRAARPFILTPEQGAQTSIHLAASPEVEGLTGRYYVNRRPRTSSAPSYSREAQSRLWAISEELVGTATPAAPV
jgi:NAD(P)-dependent dehydrogenase (short-subunit alcohol dehydrogenase family)